MQSNLSSSNLCSRHSIFFPFSHCLWYIKLRQLTMATMFPFHSLPNPSLTKALLFGPHSNSVCSHASPPYTLNFLGLSLPSILLTFPSIWSECFKCHGRLLSHDPNHSISVDTVSPFINCWISFPHWHHSK